MEKDEMLSRDLSLFLNEQLDFVLALQRQILAIEHAFQKVPELQDSYNAHLQKLKNDNSIPPNPQWLAHIRSVLERLQKTSSTS